MFGSMRTLAFAFAILDESHILELLSSFESGGDSEIIFSVCRLVFLCVQVGTTVMGIKHGAL